VSRGHGGLLNRAVLSRRRATDEQRGTQREGEKEGERERERENRDGRMDEARDRKRCASKASDRQETKDRTGQIKRDAGRQEETGGEDCSMGWFRATDTQSLRPR